MFFLRAGVANENINPLASSYTLGTRIRHLFASRPDDVAGFGIAAAQFGDPYRTGMQLTDTTVPSQEISYEFTYRWQICSWLALQPDMQWITRPGDDNWSNTLMMGTRIIVEI